MNVVFTAQAAKQVEEISDPVDRAQLQAAFERLSRADTIEELERSGQASGIVLRGRGARAYLVRQERFTILMAPDQRTEQLVVVSVHREETDRPLGFLRNLAEETAKAESEPA